MNSITCKDCIYDITNYEDETRPEYWLECDAPEEIPEEIYAKYGDDDLPKYCNQFKVRETT